jgi:uncharacterized protein (DUF1015 family)
MAQIAPFPGVHFDPDRVPLSDVIAPPYDVLSPQQQDALYEQNPQNIVRLILNKEESDDNDTTNRYTRAADFLHESMRDGTLVQDTTPALYEYLQRFEHPLEPERIVERRTLFVALKLEPYANGVVLPHEETHPKAKADRLNLMRATRANPEPIYGLYEDPAQTIARSLEKAHASAENPPATPYSQEPSSCTLLLKATFPGKTAPDAEQHIVYRHASPCLIGEIQDFFASRRVWIADGHHRYETALNYQQEVGDGGGEKPSDYLLIGLSAFEDSGLVVLPTHRLVKNLPQSRLEDLPLQLDRYFHVKPLSIPEARTWIKQEVPGEKRFAILRHDGALALTLRDISVMDAAVGTEQHCEAWRRLDVTILQTLVLDRSLGISWTTLAHTPDVAYTRDEDEAVQRVQSGEFQLSCLLQNPTVTEVRDVAAAGDKMPQKSTFFFPKLWSGLILRLLS